MAGRKRTHVESWMTQSGPPLEWYPKHPTGERALWWAMTKQAAEDLLYGHKQEALDALEYLWETAPWLLEELFDISERETRDEIIALLRQSRANIRIADICSLRESQDTLSASTVSRA